MCIHERSRDLRIIFLLLKYLFLLGLQGNFLGCSNLRLLKGALMGPLMLLLVRHWWAFLNHVSNMTGGVVGLA